MGYILSLNQGHKPHKGLHKFSLALRGSAPTPVEPFLQTLEADNVCEAATTRRNRR